MTPQAELVGGGRHAKRAPPSIAISNTFEVYQVSEKSLNFVIFYLFVNVEVRNFSVFSSVLFPTSCHIFSNFTQRETSCEESLDNFFT